MKEFQFFTNEKTYTYIEVCSPTFAEEKKQLLRQGFVISGDNIKARTIDDAIKKHKNHSDDRIKEYAVFSVIAGLFSGF